MKKIIAFLGSRKGLKSNTYRFTKLLLDRLLQQYDEIQYEILTPDKYNILPCLSCNNCFINGQCNQDKLDDMKIIKEKMVQADLIIFGSPVFAHNISGDMKIFIDRISCWLHIFKLAKKRSITISVSSNNGNIFVNDYLKYILDSLGANNFLDIEITENLFDNKDFIENEINTYVNLIYNELNNNTFIASKSQEKLFTSIKSIISEYPKDHNEYLYWQNNGLLNCETYQEYLLKIK